MKRLLPMLLAAVAAQGLCAADGQAMPLSAGTWADAQVNLFLPVGMLTDGTMDVDATRLQRDGGVLTTGDRTKIAIAAAPAAAYAISLPDGVQVAEGAIHVTGFQTNLPLAGELTAGHHDLAVRATLLLAPHVPPGRYAAVFDLTIQNN